MSRRRGVFALASGGVLAAAFLLLLSLAHPCLAQDSTPLTESTAVTGFATSGAGGTPAYYTITLPQTFPTDAAGITINVTPQDDSNPDLFADWTNHHPDAASRYKSRNWGEDTIVVPKTDIGTNTVLYVGVVSTYRNSNFTIVYQIDQPITLHDGQGQVGYVHKGGVAPFTFLASTRESVSIAVTGRTRVYVGIRHPLVVSGPNPNYITSWVSNYLNGVVNINKDDANWPVAQEGATPNTFYLGVYGLADADFVLTATLNNTATQLPNGLALAAEIPADETDYYQFTVRTPGCSLSFSLSVVYGDPDLFVSTTVEKPNPTSCKSSDPNAPKCRMSTAFGGDSVSYEVGTADQPATYHVGVNAYAWAASYTIIAQTVCPEDSYGSDTTRLEDGVAQHGILGKKSYRYYSFAAPGPLEAGEDPSHRDVTISLTTRMGDPDIYVRTNDGVKPSLSTYTWSSTHVGADTIVIRASDARSCQPTATGCYYNIYVYAYNDADFYISASTPVSDTLLMEGTPLMGSLDQGKVNYYTISIYVRPDETRHKPLVLSVTDFGGGDPDLYVSLTNPKPAAGASDWRSNSWFDDAINIMPSDPKYCVGVCVYHIAVVASSATTYTIVFHMSQPTNLGGGVPQQGIVAAHAFNYYEFRTSPGYGQVQFSFSAREGYADIFVTNKDVLPDQADPASYQEHVPWYRGTTQLITINEGDVGACVPSTVVGGGPQCVWTIGILGSFTNCSYTLTGTINNLESRATALVSGIAQQGQVSYQKWQYFRVEVSQPGMTLNVTLTANSGDPDLYMSDVGVPTLKPRLFNYTSMHTGGDSITVANVRPDIWYIGVYGWTTQNSSFSIMATLASPSDTPGGLNDIIQLNDAQPQSGTGEAGTYRYYMLTVLPDTPQLLVTVAKTMGDPDLYMRWDETRPTVLPKRTPTDTYQWKSNAWGDDVITVLNPQPGVYTIGVHSFATRSIYFLAASTGRVYQRLSDGVPRRGLVNADSYSYFRIFMDSPSDLTIAITPFSGDPDLFVTTTLNDAPKKEAGQHQWSSNAYQADAVTIVRGSAGACTGCFYYIGVYGFLTSSFMITANFGNEQRALESVPVTGSVVTGATQTYSFDMGAITEGSIDITVTPTNGLPSLYASIIGEVDTTSPETYNWFQQATYSGVAMSLDAATICQMPRPVPQCILHLGVHAVQSSNYTMLVKWTHSERNIQLINGRQETGTLAAGAYEYYVINVPADNMDLVVTLTSFTGDADLYVDASIHQPNMTNAAYKAWSAGTDTVSVTPATRGDWFIGVSGFTATSYAITAYAYSESETSTDLPVRLVDGVPQNSVIARGSMRRYQFYFSGDNQVDELTIALTSSLGDPDLFVTTDGTYPNRTNYNYASTTFGSDSLSIPNPPMNRIYTIGVYADTTAVFTIVAVSHYATLQLVAGVPFAEDLYQGQFEYFWTSVTDLKEDLTISVTSLNGDPDLYISRIQERPGPSNYTWKADSFRNDSITIPKDQLQLGRYYIGVTAFLNCTFTILASYQNQTMLQDGRPQHDFVMKEAQKFYTYRTQNTAHDIVFTLSPTSGYARMFVELGKEPNYLDPTNGYHWSSTNPYTAQLITIFANDTFLANQECFTTHDPLKYCTFYVLIRGASDCTYSLTVAGGANVVDLQMGIPIQGTVQPQAYQHYRFRVTSPVMDVSVTVTPTSGDPDIYMTTALADTNHEGASRGNSKWKSEQYGGDTLLVTYDDHDFALGEWEVSVYGWLYSTYIIVVTASPRIGANNVTSIALIDGLPQGGRLRTGDYAYYTFHPSLTEAGVTFSLATTTGDPDMYIAMYPQVPDRFHATWMGVHTGSDYVVVNAADPLACGSGENARSPCIFMIAVRAYATASYTLTVASTLVTGQMQSGVPLFGYVEAGKYQYYYIDVKQENVPALHLSLTALSGDPDLYASLIYERPNKTAPFFTWHSTSFGTDEISITPVQRAKYYLAVYGWNNATFTLTASYLNAVLLSPGQPFTDTVTNNNVKAYKFRIDTGAIGVRPPLGITIALNAMTNGYADIFVNTNNTNATPDQKNGWNSTSTSPSAGKYIYISPDDLQACWGDNCTYSVIVKGRSYSPLTYTLTYFYGDNVVTLAPGTSFPAVIASGTYTIFRAMVSSSGHDVSIAATPFAGAVSLYVAQEPNTAPNATSYTWGATSTAGTHVSIASADTKLKTGWLYIAVYGETDAQISLLMTTDNTLIVPGSPQDARCGAAGALKYYFLNFQQPASTDAQQGDIIFAVSATRNSLNQHISDAFPMYITTDASKPDVTKPNSTVYTWAPQMTDGVPFRIRPSDSNYCRSRCTFFIAVACPRASGYYTLTASTADVLDSLQVNAQISGLAAVSSASYYQIYLATTSNFSLVLEPCVGAANLYVSSSYTRPDADVKHHDFVLPSTLSEQVFTYAKPETSKALVDSIFFGVEPATEGPVQYRITTFYVDQFKSLAPIVKSPTLVPTALSKGAVTFLLTAAKSVLGTPADHLIYTVYWTPSDNAAAVLSTACGVALIPSQRQFNAPAAGGNFEVTLTDLEDVTYKFNVFVSDPAVSGTTGSTAYAVQQAKPNGSAGNGSGTISKLALGIGIPIAILVIIALVYLFMKNRRLSQAIEVEMHDITLPDAALRKAARGAPDVSAAERARAHHTLLNQEEDSSDTGYIAPSRQLQDM